MLSVHFLAYVAEWEFVLARWDRGDTQLLQPNYPNFMFPMVVSLIHMLQHIGCVC